MPNIIIVGNSCNEYCQNKKHHLLANNPHFLKFNVVSGNLPK